MLRKSARRYGRCNLLGAVIKAIQTHTKRAGAQPQCGDLMVRRVQRADEDTSYVIVEWSHRYVLEGPFERSRRRNGTCACRATTGTRVVRQ